MRAGDKRWIQCPVNSMPQIPPTCQNVLAQTSQNNIQQQQQFGPQSHSGQGGFFPNNQPGGPMQNPFYQPYQQDQFAPNLQPGMNPYQANPQVPFNPYIQMGQNQPPCGPLPQNALDQIRAYIGNPTPIFILPNNCPSQPSAPPQLTPMTIPPPMMYPPIIYPPAPPSPCCSNPCYPFAFPLPVLDPFGAQRGGKEKQGCGCSQKRSNSSPCGTERSPGSCCSSSDHEDHSCMAGPDDTICAKRNCPSSINLQALASQLLSMQGIVPCAATRLVLRKVPGSNVNTTMEETVERAQKSINLLNKDQLLAEARNAQQVNALINLHMTANPPPNVVPVLTTIQLKVNVLKAHVESLVNRRLMESQGVGAESGCSLDPVILALKTDAELRELLASLRDKECEERVNLNFAPYRSQRVIAEARMNNIRNKICQVEEEMDRRRSQQFANTPFLHGQGYPDIQATPHGRCQPYATSTQDYDSPDPFVLRMQQPRRLNLKPCVGSPETTYDKPDDQPKKDLQGEKSRCCEKRPDRIKNPECCSCEDDSGEESVDEGKKKLRGPGEKRKGSQNGESQGEVVLKLPPDVVLVIDGGQGRDEETPRGRKKDEQDLPTFKEAITCPEKDDTIKGDEVMEVEEGKEVWSSAEELKGEDVEEDGSARSSTACGVGGSCEKSKCEEDERNVGDEGGEDCPGKRRNRFTEGGVTFMADVKFERTPFKDESNKTLDFGETESERNVVADEKSLAVAHDSDGSSIEGKDSIRNEKDCDEEETQRKGSLKRCSESVLSSLKRASTNGTIEGRIFSTISAEEKMLDPSEIDSKKLEITDKENCSEVLEIIQDSVPSRKILPGKDPRQRSAVLEDWRGSQKFRHIERRGNAEEQDADGEILRVKGNLSKGSREDHKTKVEGQVQLATPRCNVGFFWDLFSTIGSQAGCFGSFIEKFATTGSWKNGEYPNDVSCDTSDDFEGYAGNSRGKEESWYLKFSALAESGNNRIFEKDGIHDALMCAGVDGRCSVLRRVTHAVLEDPGSGGNYVTINESSQSDRNEDPPARPYKVRRSLLIRSRKKSSEVPEKEAANPLEIVRSPIDEENCLALFFASKKPKEFHRPNKTRKLKSSEKFWTLPSVMEVDDEAKRSKFAELRYADSKRDQDSMRFDFEERKKLRRSSERVETRQIKLRDDVNYTDVFYGKNYVERTIESYSSTLITEREDVINIHEY
ncbi:uncharacterized protein LOC105700449 [Orussus abietinus]|uniref:uncharacterized protein LOC105700449 n=1 Tax=Orussus abietinus TaxID=222816 RepID=UPI000C715CC2|nr:uncharacterized protein LOC105700449 [Orussus abietinus]